MNRRALWLLLLFALLNLLSCSASNNGNTALDAEADRKGQEYLARTVVKCGEDYYAKAHWLDIFRGDAIQMAALYQLKTPVAIVEKDESPITEADRLNGIEWRGKIVVVAIAHRYRYSSMNVWSGWNDMSPYNGSTNPLFSGAPLDSALYKKNGQWNIDEVSTDPRDKPLDCSQIPQ